MTIAPLSSSSLEGYLRGVLAEIEREIDFGDGRHGRPADEPVEWDVPGVTGVEREREPEPLPPVSGEVAELQRLVARVCASDPVRLSAAQAAVDARALLQVEQQLRVHALAVIADVDRRGLHDLTGSRSTLAFVREHRPDGDGGDVAFSRGLRWLPQVQAAVSEGRISLAAARLLRKALAQVTPHLDRPDGRIDEQPGDQVMPAIVGNTIGLVCRYQRGLVEDDPRLGLLIARGQQVLGLPTQAEQVQACFVLLAEHVHTQHLSGHLQELLFALLPSKLEQAERDGHDNRGLVLRKKPDGSGWYLHGDLDLETGEQLFVGLRAEAGRDPDNHADTAAWQRLRERKASTDPLFAGQPERTPTPMPASTGLAWFDLPDTDAPRSKNRRLHDALNRLLARYLDTGLGGTTGKVPTQIAVVITEPALSATPGHLPARTDSGSLIPRELVKRWWTDSTVTAFVMSLGGKALRVTHGQRTLTATERRALHLETGGLCAGLHCCPTTPDPLRRLTPHHTSSYSTNGGQTSLDHTLPVCDQLHHDIHTGNKTVQLRDGTYLNEQGTHTRLPKPEPPPF